jgi:DNA-binding LacI/PurR family transcriptional regulator
MSTVRDIAQKAGVSGATVSRVLNNHPSVNDATRYAVLQAAQELNYPLENLRTAPRLHRSALVLTRIDINMSPPGSGIFERSVWTGVHSVLENREIATRLQQSAMTIEEAERYAEDVSISGLVILGGAINRAFIEALQRLTVPFVIAGAHVHPLNGHPAGDGRADQPELQPDRVRERAAGDHDQRRKNGRLSPESGGAWPAL